MKKRSLIIILLALSVGFISVNAKAALVDSNTIATFADPSRNSSNPLFKVDFRPGQNKFTGGWDDDKTGLTLKIPYTGATFVDAWFEMSDVNITSTTIIPGGGKFGLTGSGAIDFYANNTSANPLVTIAFESGLVSRYGFSGSDETPDGDFIATNVTITGSEITGELSEEQFSFGFANLKCLPGSSKLNDGFTATAAFTSSAIVNPVNPAIPEPATICLLGLGGLALLRRKKRA
jgi:hypothetical protein